MADKADCLLGAAVLLSLIGCSGVWAADDDELPDMDFLEYLGSWEESDEDWLLFDRSSSDGVVADKDVRSDPVPEGKESTEFDDES